MTTAVMSKLASLVRQEKEALLTRWRSRVRELPSAAHLDIPTLNDHIPDLLDELAAVLEEPTEQVIVETMRDGSPPDHGVQRLEDGFDITEVVSEYSILRGCVHDLAWENGLPLEGKPFHVLNRLLDEAIGLAVKTYADQRALEVKQRRQEYLAFVAHDLRNPLTAISLAAGVLELNLQGTGDHESGQMIKTLHRNVVQLETLVAKVMEENSASGGDDEGNVETVKRSFDLWPLVEAIVHAMKPVATTAGTALLNHVPEELVVLADSGQLRRVLQNLITNAITYSPGGTVEIGGLLNEADSLVECWVSDTGKGIAADRLDKVFEKGEGDNERAESTGLGLAIVKSFVEGHGGEVRAESVEGQGTTIRFTLPLR
ncbi:MAG: sensor histidine kinase [Flavobacteriales bacterium]|nr:sensor histidine kinase [Flavobacteriales bacterium]